MRKWPTLLALLATTVASHAISFSFRPNDGVDDPDDLDDLEHQYAYGFGISTTATGSGKTLRDLIGTGAKITSATIKIDNIWDWKVEQDYLYINLLDGLAVGVTRKGENPDDDYFSNYFAAGSRSTGIAYSGSLLVDRWSDSVGGYDRNYDYNYGFSTDELTTLTNFILSGSSFGLGFDPDCHYYNKGIEFCIEVGPTPTQTSTVPDGGSTAAMLGLALLGAGTIHARLRKAQPAVA